MKNAVLIGAILLLTIQLGFAQNAQIVERKTRTARANNGRSVTKTIGQLNWTGQYIEAEGESFFNREKFTIPGQAEGMALEGAKAVALANLLEIVEDVKVTKTTTVENLANQSVSIKTEVQGKIRGAQLVSKVQTANSWKVVMRLPLYGEDGLGDIFREEDIEEPEPLIDTAKTKGTDPIDQTVDELLKVSRENENAAVPLFKMSNTSQSKELANNLTLMPQNIFNEKGELVIDLEQVFKKTGKAPQFLNYSNELLSKLRKAGVNVEIIDTYYRDGKIVINESQIDKSASSWKWIKEKYKVLAPYIWKLLPLLLSLF